MSMLDSLAPHYRLILCDIWGCVHDGVRLYPGAAERLLQWRAEQRKVVLITNAPRTAEAVEQQLLRIGLPRDCWNGIATGGEAGIAALLELDEPVGFIGTSSDRTVLAGKNVPFATDDRFTDLACTGLESDRPDTSDYQAQLRELVARGVRMHCLNPDRIVVRGGHVEACAGELADLYEALGGEVEWYGKPHETIYRHALHLGGDPPAEQVLAIGDSLETDVLGAARMGFDCVFVAGGIHAGEAVPADFWRRKGLGSWRPLATVERIG